MNKILRNQVVEEFAAARLGEFEALLGSKLEPPIPIELMAERLLGLSILWETIDELPGETIFGGIRPEERLIVMNEKRRALFTEMPGLVRSTVGHEMGLTQPRQTLPVGMLGLGNPRRGDRHGPEEEAQRRRDHPQAA